MEFSRDIFRYIKHKNTVIIVLVITLIFSLKGCYNNSVDIKNNNDSWRALADQQTDSLIQVINDKGEEITTQKQLLITEKQVKEMLLLENENLKKISSKVKIKTVTRIEKVLIPYDTTIFIPDSLHDSTFIAQGFSIEDKWYGIKGIALKKGIYIDKIEFNNEIETTIGYEKHKGIKKLWKESNAVVEINNKNPYSQIVKMENIVIKPPKKKFYQTKTFYFVAGAFGSLILFK